VTTPYGDLARAQELATSKFTAPEWVARVP
jgi:hypothetical protein